MLEKFFFLLVLFLYLINFEKYERIQLYDKFTLINIYLIKKNYLK